MEEGDEPEEVVGAGLDARSVADGLEEGHEYEGSADEGEAQHLLAEREEEEDEHAREEDEPREPEGEEKAEAGYDVGPGEGPPQPVPAPLPERR